MKKALYAGSFDPITRGHINIIHRALDMFDEVVVAVGHNDDKKCLFDIDTRIQLISDALGDVDGRCMVYSFTGLAADYAKTIGAKFLIKGARTTQDFDYERLINDVSLTQQCDLETVLMFSDHRLSHVSSSAVKTLAKHVGVINEMVTPNVRRALDIKNGRTIVGVTGTIGSGKSTLCKRLVQYYDAERIRFGATYSNVYRIDLDDTAKSLFERKDALGESVRSEVMKTFGTSDRKQLGEIVFSDRTRLNQLNEIYRAPMLTCLRIGLSKVPSGLFFLEGALLFEFGWEFLCSSGKMVVVNTPSADVHASRLRRRGYTDEQIAHRLSSQLTVEEKLERAKTAVQNDELTSVFRYDTQSDDFDSLIRELNL